MASFPTPEISPSLAPMHPFPASLAYTLYIRGAEVLRRA